MSDDILDLDGVKDDTNRMAVAIGFVLVALAGFVDWYEIEASVSDGDYTETVMEVDVTGEDAREGIDNAKYLWFLSFIGLGAILLNKIGDDNYGNLFLGMGVVCLLLAYSVYSEIKEAADDAEDAADEMADWYSEDGYDISGDLDMKYKMGYYMTLIGPLVVLYGGYNLYNENKNRP